MGSHNSRHGPPPGDSVVRADSSGTGGLLSNMRGNSNAHRNSDLANTAGVLSGNNSGTPSGAPTPQSKHGYSYGRNEGDRESGRGRAIRLEESVSEGTDDTGTSPSRGSVSATPLDMVSRLGPGSYVDAEGNQTGRQLGRSASDTAAGMRGRETDLMPDGARPRGLVFEGSSRTGPHVEVEAETADKPADSEDYKRAAVKQEVLLRIRAQLNSYVNRITCLTVVDNEVVCAVHASHMPVASGVAEATKT